MSDIIDAARLKSGDIRENIPPQLAIDGFMIPQGACTLLSIGGGSGKTTSAISAAIAAASSGQFDLFGRRTHDRPLSAILVLGEEFADQISRKLAHEMPGGMDAYRKADELGNINIICWGQYAAKQPQPELLFNESGELTESGGKLFSAIRKRRPDFVFFDTLSSLSAGDYMQDRTSYATMRELNALAYDTGAAVILTMHVVKDSDSKISANSTAGDLISLARGSAALVNSSRHVIAMVRAPEGSFKGIEIEDEDSLWLAGVKTNLLPNLSGKVFPVIRSAARRTFVAVTDSGDTVAHEYNEADRAVVSQLRSFLPRLIRAASEAFQPLGQSGAMSPERLSQGALRDIFPPCTEEQVSRAIESLIISREIVQAISTRSGAGKVYDWPLGLFAHENEYEHLSQEKLKFKKGAANVTMLRNRIFELEEYFMRNGVNPGGGIADLRGHGIGAGDAMGEGRGEVGEVRLEDDVAAQQ